MLKNWQNSTSQDVWLCGDVHWGKIGSILRNRLEVQKHMLPNVLKPASFSSHIRLFKVRCRQSWRIYTLQMGSLGQSDWLQSDCMDWVGLMLWPLELLLVIYVFRMWTMGYYLSWMWHRKLVNYWNTNKHSKNVELNVLQWHKRYNMVYYLYSTQIIISTSNVST